MVRAVTSPNGGVGCGSPTKDATLETTRAQLALIADYQRTTLSIIEEVRAGDLLLRSQLLKPLMNLADKQHDVLLILEARLKHLKANQHLHHR